jgi:PadR family transcriptional regulator AphA
VPKVNRTKYAILGMLSIGPMSGYDMKKRFSGSIVHFWNEDYGGIYPMLRRLEEEGLVEKRMEQVEGSPQRHVYTINEKGLNELYDWLLLPAERPNLRIELLLKLFYGHAVPKENLISKVEEEKRFCEEALETFKRIEDHITSMEHHNDLTGAKFWLITLSYGKHYYTAVRKWCNETLAVLRAVDAAGDEEAEEG